MTTNNLHDLLYPMAYIVLALIVAVAVGHAAERRGRSKWGWGVASFLITPLPVYVVLRLMPGKLCAVGHIGPVGQPCVVCHQPILAHK